MGGFSIRSCAPLAGPGSRAAASLSLGAIAALAFCAPVLAESPAAATRNGCAKFGTNYVAVAGAEGCVRIGGHVRAEMSHPEAPSLMGAPAGLASAVADGVRSVSQTFHIRPADDTQLYRR
jgi:Porin subfamily